MAKKKKSKYISAPTGEDLERIESGEKFSDITASPIQKAIKGAFSEDVEEIESMSETPEIKEDNVTEKPVKKKSKKRTMYMWLGIFVSVMTIVGIVFTVMASIIFVKKITNNTEQKQELAQYIYPLVIVDVPVIEDTSKLPVETILRTAAWDIIINFNPESSKYVDEYGYITVPATDLEVVATRLFGKNIDFEHQPLGDAVLYFAYDEKTKSYTLPTVPTTMAYRPKVESITKISEKELELRVGYYVPVQDWQSDKIKNQADKYLKYTIIKEEKGYKIKSIGEYEDSYVNPM